MSTGLSSIRTAGQDLRAILAFRSSGLTSTSRRRIGYAGGVVLLLTAAAVVVPAYASDRFPYEHSGSLLALVPTMCLAFLGFSIVSAVASAGGREVIPREQAVAFPVSTTTDHLGALLLAPLNIAWMLQAWTLLGTVSYVLGPHHLFLYELPILVWLPTATALAQIVGWLSEGVRRGPHGQTVHRAAVAAIVGVLALLLVSGRLSAVLDRAPTRLLLDLVGDGAGQGYVEWAIGLLLLVALGVGAVLLGAWPASWALHRPMREELRLEGGRYPARANTRSDLGMMLRLDRSAIWRSVPLRRGMTVLAVMPGAVALAGGLQWQMVTIMPGLVAAGGALLFGVNTWCLDARGALWRDNLPVSPGVGFAARALVLTEVLVVSALVTVALSAVRAGVPSAPEVVALGCATVVVILQVVGASMRWSIRRPYAVDLRSARATPAPPVVMAGYSARLALSTTFSGLLFYGFATTPVLDDSGAIRLTLACTLFMLCWSGTRLWLSSQAWSDPVVRSRVIATVAG